MSLTDLYDQSMYRWETFELEPVLPSLRSLNDGAMDDVLNVNGCRYYQWLPCLIDVLKPKQVVELGGAMGVASLMMLHTLPEDAQLYSITLPEGGLEFSYVKDTYPNFHPTLGTDLDLGSWHDIDFATTDLWFIDAEHTAKHLQAELDLYTPFFKKGAILLFDDIRMEELWPIWQSLPYEKKEITNPMHYSGFGIAQV